MSYRSEVVVCLYKEDYLYALQIMKKLKISKEDNLLINSDRIILKEDTYILLHYDWFNNWNFFTRKDMQFLYKILEIFEYYIVTVGEDGYSETYGDLEELWSKVYSMSRIHIDDLDKDEVLTLDELNIKFNNDDYYDILPVVKKDEVM
jgi:hypothetical protein